MNKTLLLALAASLSLPTAHAQTGRIAHFSHGGSVAALAGAADNFGNPALVHVEWKLDTLTYLNDSIAVHRGQARSWISSTSEASATWHREVQGHQYKSYLYPDEPKAPAAIIERLHQRFPQATFIGFHKLMKAKLTRPAPRRPSNRSQSFPLRPFQYSFWRGLCSVAAIGAVGWLLGKKRPA